MIPAPYASTIGSVPLESDRRRAALIDLCKSPEGKASVVAAAKALCVVSEGSWASVSVSGIYGLYDVCILGEPLPVREMTYVPAGSPEEIELDARVEKLGL